MEYTMRDIEERSGLTSRTIRDYIRHGYLAKPSGHGLAAVYDEEQLLRVVTIARMRARRVGWDEIAVAINSWSLAKFRKYVRETDPVAAPPPAAAPDAPALEGEPVAARLPPPRRARPSAELDVADGEDLDGLDDTAHFVMAQVLPGLALFVRHDASPLVKRVAAEIVRKYRVR